MAVGAAEIHECASLVEDMYGDGTSRRRLLTAALGACVALTMVSLVYDVTLLKIPVCIRQALLTAMHCLECYGYSTPWHTHSR